MKTLNGDELTCDGGLKVLAVELYDGVVGVVQAAIHTLVDLKIRVADPNPGVLFESGSGVNGSKDGSKI